MCFVLCQVVFHFSLFLQMSRIIFSKVVKYSYDYTLIKCTYVCTYIRPDYLYGPRNTYRFYSCQQIQNHTSTILHLREKILYPLKA